MNQIATMFLNNISVVDHCIIHNDGAVVGGSYNPSFLVSGRIDPVEKVVVDFSTVKKQLKACIDGKSQGFDHKCWIIENYSAAVVEIEGEIITDFSKLVGVEHYSDEQLIHVTTPMAYIIAPKNAFKFIPVCAADENAKNIDEAAGFWFERDLKAAFPDLDFVCRNNIEAHVHLPDMPYVHFSYAHGLKDSTSYGCQNIAHGHLSFIQVNVDTDEALALLDKMAQELHCTMFINRENVIKSEINEALGNLQTHMTYQSHSRGTFFASWIDCDRQKVVIIPTETTIEYLVAYVADRYADQLKAIGATQLYVSEGLSKGAFIDLSKRWNEEI